MRIEVILILLMNLFVVILISHFHRFNLNECLNHGYHEYMNEYGILESTVFAFHTSIQETELISSLLEVTENK